MEERDPAIPANISLKESILSFIDKHRVNHGFKTRSHYIQWLVLRDIKFNRVEMFAEVTGAMVLPMMGFFFFMVLAVLTHGLLFYLFMSVFGIFAVFLSIIYYNKRKQPRERKKVYK